MSEHPINPKLQLPEEPELPKPENFNLDAWVSGVKSTIRATNIYARADLIAEIDAAEAQLKILRQVEAVESSFEDASEISELEELVLALHEKFVESGVTFKVQGRSENWLAAKEKEWRNHRDTNGLSKDEKTVFLQLHQLADSIVEPEGVTYEHLVQLREASEPQIRKLLVSFALANNSAPHVTVPFSPQSSATPRTRRR